MIEVHQPVESRRSCVVHCSLPQKKTETESILTGSLRHGCAALQNNSDLPGSLRSNFPGATTDPENLVTSRRRLIFPLLAFRQYQHVSH